jgi:hypothetical protein
MLYQKGRYFGIPKCFQSYLTVRRNTNILLLPNIHLNLISTGQDSIYLGQENCSMFSQRDTEPFSPKIAHKHWLPPPSSVLGPSVYQTSPLTAGGVSGPLFHYSLVIIVTLYLGSKLYAGLITLTRILNMGSDCWSHIDILLFPWLGWR